MRKYRRITYEDRCQIYALSKRGASQEDIARILGVSQSTVSRELWRNRGQRGYRFKPPLIVAVRGEDKGLTRRNERVKCALFPPTKPLYLHGQLPFGSE